MTPLGGDELGMGPSGRDQVGMAPAGHYLPLVEHDHAVGRDDGRQLVCNDQGRASRHQARHGALDQLLALAVGRVRLANPHLLADEGKLKLHYASV